MLSFTRRIASARRRAWSDGLRKMKNVRRCAVFTPTPGSFENSSISAATGDAMLFMIFLEHSWQPHTAGGTTKQLLLRLGYSIKSILSSSQNHNFQFSDVLCIKSFGINLDSENFILT